MFINREKFDCVVDYNRANHEGLEENSMMYLSGQNSEEYRLRKEAMERQ